MSLNINIDESPIRPNVRPPRPPSKRGTLTFIAEIVENNRPDIFRNLTRGVDETVEPSPTPPVTGTSVNVSLDTIPIYLELLSLGFKGVNTPLNLATVSSTLTVSADFASSDSSLRRDLGNVFTTLTASADFLAIANVRKDLGNVSTTLTASADFLAIANVRKDLGQVDVSLEASSLSVGTDTSLGSVFTTLSASSISLADQLNLGIVSSTLTVDADFLAITNVRKDLGIVSSTLTVDADFLAITNVRKDLGQVDVSLEASSLSLGTDTSLGSVFTTLSASSISLADQLNLGSVFTTLTASADFLAIANVRKDLGIVSSTLTVDALSSIATANVREDLEMLGPEVIVNGDFATNSDWTGTGSNGWSIDTASQQLDAVAATSYVYQGLSVVSGKAYQVTVDATLTSGACVVKGFNATTIIDINISGRNTYTALFSETDTNPNFGFDAGAGGFTGSIHSVTLKEVLNLTTSVSPLTLGVDLNLGSVFTTLTASADFLAIANVRKDLGSVSSTLTVSADFLATANQREALGLVEINLEASGLSLATDVGSLERVDTTLEANVLSLNTDLSFSLPDNMVTPPDIDP